MGRGVSYGGGQSSLGYLFGSGEAPKPAANNTQAVPTPSEGKGASNGSSHKPSACEAVDATKQIPAGIQSNPANNYFRADGQNTGNFLTVMAQLNDIIEAVQGFNNSKNMQPRDLC